MLKDIYETSIGAATVAFTFLHDIYPTIAVIATLLGLCLTIHSLCRIIWNYTHRDPDLRNH